MPTPDINAVIRGQEFFRLKEALQSSGAIFELDESTRAIYIGPDSDVGEVRIQYFDPDGPNSIQSATVSVNGPLVGRLDALLETKIPATGQPARILISPVDQIDNTYQGLLPLSVPFRLFTLPTFIDIIAALKDLPDIPSVRPDRTLRLARVPYLSTSSGGPDDGSTNLVIPIYGRRMATISIVSQTTFRPGYGLVNLTPGFSTSPRFLGYQPGVGLIKTVVIRASDAARIGQTFTLAGAANGFYEESDVILPDTPLSAIVQPRGMADLLVLNIRYNIDPGGAPATHYADVYVTLSDRET